MASTAVPVRTKFTLAVCYIAYALCFTALLGYIANWQPRESTYSCADFVEVAGSLSVLVVAFTTALSPKPFHTLNAADAVCSVPMVSLISLSIATASLKPDSSTRPAVEISLASTVTPTGLGISSKTLTLAAIGMFIVFGLSFKRSTYSVARFTGFCCTLMAPASIFGWLPNLYLSGGGAFLLGSVSTHSSVVNFVPRLAWLHRVATSVVLPLFLIELANEIRGIPASTLTFLAVYSIPFAAFFVWTLGNTKGMTATSSSFFHHWNRRWNPFMRSSGSYSVEVCGHCSVVGLCIGKALSSVAGPRYEYMQVVLHLMVHANKKLACIFSVAAPQIGPQLVSRQLLTEMPPVSTQELGPEIQQTVGTTLLVFALMAVGTLVAATATKRNARSRRAADHAKAIPSADTAPSTDRNALHDVGPSSSTSIDFASASERPINRALIGYGNQPCSASIDTSNVTISIEQASQPEAATPPSVATTADSVMTSDDASPSGSLLRSDYTYDEFDALFLVDGLSVEIPCREYDVPPLDPRLESSLRSSAEVGSASALAQPLMGLTKQCPNGSLLPRGSLVCLPHGGSIRTANGHIAKRGSQSRDPHGTLSPQAKTSRKREPVPKPQAADALAKLHEKQMQLRQQIAEVVASSGTTSSTDSSTSATKAADAGSPTCSAGELTVLRREAKRAYSKAYRIQQKGKIDALEVQLDETKMMLQAMYSAHMQLRIQHAQLAISAGNAAVSASDSISSEEEEESTDNPLVPSAKAQYGVEELRNQVENLRREWQAQKEVADSRESMVRQLLTSIGSFNKTQPAEELAAAVLARYNSHSKFPFERSRLSIPSVPMP